MVTQIFPSFLGSIYDHNKDGQPQLVSKLYSVNNESATLHMVLTGKIGLKYDMQQWAKILLGVCNALEAVHTHGFLHNDIKGDNIVLSDIVPFYANSPPLVPVLVDFGKSRPIFKAKRYKLTQEEQIYYRLHHSHIAPEVINRTHPQSVKSDVYSLGRIICKCAKHISSPSLQRVGQKCMITNPEYRPLPIGLYSHLSECV